MESSMTKRPIRRFIGVATIALGAVVGSAASTTNAGDAMVADPGAPQGPFCSSIPAEGEGSFAGMADDPVAVAASNNPYLTTLTAAVRMAGLDTALSGPGPFTVLAPSNEAFAAVPPADLDAILADTAVLADILSYHVIAGAMSADELAEAGRVESIQGGELRFAADEDGALVINGGAAMTTCWNIPTSNAIVHVIDRVLTPPSPNDCFTRC
jgi:uncharacterized surface protein with fasciclin (FAS1) repeats